MSKRTNILSLSQVTDLCDKKITQKFTRYNEVNIRTGEKRDLSALIEQLSNAGMNASDAEGYFVGYEIPQIGKEFDLLRFGENYNLNIELKSSSDCDKILKQLTSNKYYLEALDKPTRHFSFVSEGQSFYQLDDNGKLEKVTAKKVVEAITKQTVREDIINANDLFNPSDYLVSPFNSTSKFLEGKYFLTQQQEEFKKKILTTLSGKGATFVSLTGAAGTGKTLLAYDIYRHAIRNNSKALLIHCGNLNSGHRTLQKVGWSVSAIIDLDHYLKDKLDLIIVDEAQRLKIHQLKKIREFVLKVGCKCIFSHDQRQTLANSEALINISATIDQSCDKNVYKLSTKIRTNKEIANFIKSLFNNKAKFDKSNTRNIQLRYFHNASDSKKFLKSLDKEQWEVLKLTPSLYNKEFNQEYAIINSKNSHQIIGQEFEGVVVVLDKYFSYNKNGELIYNGRTHYSPTGMLFQNITRARKRLLIIVQDNEELLNRCLQIL